MTTLKIGISNYPFDRERYLKDFSVVELRYGLNSPPSNKALRRWARQAPAGFEHLWVAWQWFTHDHRSIRGGALPALLEGERVENFGLFKDTPECRRAWASTLEGALAVQASVILLETPTSFTPSTANKDRFKAWAQGWSGRPAGLPIAWFPSGFWQREEAIELASDLGIILAVDPFLEPNEPLPPGPIGYFKLNGRVGLGNSYTADDLERLHLLAAAYDTLYAVFRTETSTKDARQLQRLAAELGDPALLLADGAGYDLDDDFDDLDDDDAGDDGDDDAGDVSDGAGDDDYGGEADLDDLDEDDDSDDEGDDD
jgi:uncharacterized protein YecE (DUF72 family)